MILFDFYFQFQEKENYIVFKNSLILGADDPSSPIPPTEINIECRVKRTHRVDLDLMSVSLNTKVSYGNFSFALDMFSDNTYNTKYNAEDYPVDVKVGDLVYMAGSVTTVNGLDVLAKDCYATPSEDPNDETQYSLIEDG